jgi:hypothetical protein
MIRASVSHQFPRGQEAAVASYNSGLGIYQDRIVGAELGDAGGDSINRHVGVRSRIAGEGNELVNQPQLDMLNHRFQKHASPFGTSKSGGAFRTVRFALIRISSTLNVQVGRRGQQLDEFNR